jgi:carbon-monoxide dehydrogenase small subunit
MLLTAQELLRDNPTPSGAAIRTGLSGNYCRCTGYHAIIEAILATARRRREGGRG